MITVTNGLRKPDEAPFEVVEIKGRGHPDTVVDEIADEISRLYSRFCLENFGVICNHWVDKCVLIGGESFFEFGSSRMVSPMRLLVIGKATTSVGEHEIPIGDMARKAADKVIGDLVDLYNSRHDLEIKILTNNYCGAGRQASWYRPDLDTVRSQHNMIEANDAVICSGFAPFSMIEELTHSLSELFFTEEFCRAHPFIGSDIKVICHRIADDLKITACVPFKASQCPNRAFYDRELQNIHSIMASHTADHLSRWNSDRAMSFEIYLNTRDTESVVYMSHYGSCLDTGDVGAVGRGNRTSGLITPSRPMSIEAPAGKNPRYHSGKILDIAAKKIAANIYDEIGCAVEVTISTQTGRPLTDPLGTIIQLESNADQNTIRSCHRIASKVLGNVHSLTSDFVYEEAK